jgi:UDP:flavonoid glycosyltransferase YjiC (YdhE family)
MQLESTRSRTKTILFAPASNILFHVGRCAVVARELSLRGHRILMLGSPRYLTDPAIAATAEFTFHPSPDFSADEGMALLRSVLTVPERRLVERMIVAEVDALRRLRPDLVVSDFRPTMRISARECGAPLASLLLSHWTPQYAHRPEWIPRSYPIFTWSQRLLGDRVARSVAPPAFRFAIRYKTGPLRRAARSWGQAAPALLWDHLQGDLNLLTDPQVLCPVELPASFQRVGPILWEPEAPLPARLANLDRGRPVLFVNFGSTGHPDLFRRTFAELGGGRHQVILATCGQIDPRDFEVPANFFVEKFLPVAKVMQIADLVVYHGGAGTFHQAVRAGVPGIVVATHWDQEYAGFLTEKHELGRFLTLRELLASPGALLERTEQVLGSLPLFRERVGKLRAEFLQYDGPKAAADCLERFLGLTGQPAGLAETA